jgi:hypothetical protein
MRATTAMACSLLFGLAALGAAAPAQALPMPQPQGPTITLDTAVPVKPGQIHNSPNGHISYRRENGALTIWVPGRVANSLLGPAPSPKGGGAVPPPLEGGKPAGAPSGKRTSKDDSTQGAFRLAPPPRSWSKADLEAASPVLAFKATHSQSRCDQPDGWYRDYAAINAVIPGPGRGELLAFIDGEFHPDPGAKGGVPLLASIGLATSTDGGAHWAVNGQVLAGVDAASADCSAIVASMTHRNDNEGAAGPSALVRTDAGQQYIYVYYADRVRRSLPKGARPTSNIYVARTPYAGNHTEWQSWTGKAWGAPRDQMHAAAVVVAPPGSIATAHPQVTWNTYAKRWLMVFHTRKDLYFASSADGVAWTAPVVLKTPGQGKTPSFPSLISDNEADQQTTSQTGWLFYSRKDSKAKAFVGYEQPFTLANPAQSGLLPAAGEVPPQRAHPRGRGRGQPPPGDNPPHRRQQGRPQ